MAIEKVGIYRKWLEPVPKRNGNPIPKSEWPRKRRYCWIVRWCGTNLQKYGKLFKTRKEAEKYALDLEAGQPGQGGQTPTGYATAVPFGA